LEQNDVPCGSKGKCNKKEGAGKRGIAELINHRNMGEGGKVVGERRATSPGTVQNILEKGKEKKKPVRRGKTIG